MSLQDLIDTYIALVFAGCTCNRETSTAVSQACEQSTLGVVHYMLGRDFASRWWEIEQ